MSTQRGIFDAAIDRNIQMAADWGFSDDFVSRSESTCRRSVDKLLDSLTGAETERFLGYVNQFSVVSAAWIIEDVVGVWFVGCKGSEPPPDLARFREDYITARPGLEERKRAADTPHRVFKAALRKFEAERFGIEQAYILRMLDRIAGVVNSFNADQQGKLRDCFERYPVAAVFEAMRTWCFIDDASTRLAYAHEQYRRWSSAEDESIWFTRPSYNDPIWFPKPDPHKRVFEQALDSHLCNHINHKKIDAKTHVRMQFEALLDSLAAPEQEKLLACFDKFPVEQVATVLRNWPGLLQKDRIKSCREIYNKWIATGDDSVWFDEQPAQSPHPSLGAADLEAALAILKEAEQPTETRFSETMENFRKSAVGRLLEQAGMGIAEAVFLSIENKFRKEAGLEPKKGYLTPTKAKKPEDSGVGGAVKQQVDRLAKVKEGEAKLRQLFPEDEEIVKDYRRALFKEGITNDEEY